jgi:polyhydroxybutyrate depolymerase
MRAAHGANVARAWAIGCILALTVGCKDGGQRSNETPPSPPLPDPVAPTSASAPSTPPQPSSPATAASADTKPTEPALEAPHYFPPEASPENKRPLLVFLHGLGATGKLAFDVLGLGGFGKKHRLFVVAPTGDVDRAKRAYWNAHPACCDFDGRGIDHTQRIRMLIDDLMAFHPIDPQKVFVMGFSNGGFFAHRLACLLADRLAGVVSVAGAGPDPALRCVAAKHLRVLEIHGDADKTVFYEGGTLFERPGATYASATSTFEDWAARLGCTGPAEDTGARDLEPKLPGNETDTREHRNCERGSVALWTVHGGSHLIAARAAALEQAWQYVAPAAD